MWQSQTTAEYTNTQQILLSFIVRHLFFLTAMPRYQIVFFEVWMGTG